MALLEVAGIGKSFGSTAVLRDISFDLQKGEALAIIGSSGSGKTTLLRCLNFLETADTGSITVAGETLWSADDARTQSEAVLRKKRLHFGLVFQNFNLFPQYTALQNVMLAGELLAKERPDYKQNRKQIHDELEEHARELLAQMGLSDRAGHYPHQLSGGQQQRVGVARALAANPQVLLMDEPFGALDPVTRGALQAEMTRIHRILGRTIVLVTHDIDEALRLADHLVLMDHGEVVQQGSPLELLTWPKNDFVREFFGRSELGVRLLSLRTVSDYMRREAAPVSGEPLQAQMSLRDALSAFVARQCEVLPVSDARGAPCGTLHFRDLLAGEVTREGTA